MKRIIQLCFMVLLLSACLFNKDVLAANYNSIDTAKIIELKEKVSGVIAENDFVDYYKFTLDESSELTIDLKAEMERMYVDLYDANGETVSSDELESNSNGIVIHKRSYFITRGTYYIQISRGYYYPSYYYGAYTFEINAKSADETFSENIGGENNSLLDANVLELGKQCKGQIAYNDHVDYYTLKLDESSELILDLEAEMERMYVDLYDANGEAIANDELESNSNGVIVYNRKYMVTQGMYYIKISRGYYYPSYYYGTYAFEINAESANETFSECLEKNNNSLADADDLDLGKEYKGQIAYNDHIDYYCFALDKSSEVALDLDAKMERMYVDLYDANGDTVANDELISNSNGTISYKKSYIITPGKYYIKISRGYYYPEHYYGTYSFSICSHDWGIVSSNPATCELEGTVTKRCNKCGREITETIEKLGHNVIKTEKIPNSCVNNGKTSGSYCSRCGTTIEESKVILAYGHDLFYRNVEATYVSKGYRVYTCEECGFSYKDNYIAKLKVNCPNLLSIKKGKKLMKVYLSNNYNLSGVKIQYSTKKKFSKKVTKTVSVNGNYKLIRKLKSKKKYYVRVRGYKIQDGKKVYSSWSKVKTVKIK